MSTTLIIVNNLGVAVLKQELVRFIQLISMYHLFRPVISQD
jgi:hypothetical protein